MRTRKNTVRGSVPSLKASVAFSKTTAAWSTSAVPGCPVNLQGEAPRHVGRGVWLPSMEHYWWNPAKLPTPAEWVNVRRVRVKDAINTIWWLSKTPYPKASNRRVLQPYSKSMRSLLRNGYQPKLRPSGHNISTHFAKNNGGSIPPNLLAIANTESNGRYQEYCRQENLDIHPARFPMQLPEISSDS